MMDELRKQISNLSISEKILLVEDIWDMDRTFNKAKNFKEAEEWDIKQQINMSPRQRQKIAKKYRKILNKITRSK